MYSTKVSPFVSSRVLNDGEDSAAEELRRRKNSVIASMIDTGGMYVNRSSLSSLPSEDQKKTALEEEAWHRSTEAQIHTWRTAAKHAAILHETSGYHYKKRKLQYSLIPIILPFMMTPLTPHIDMFEYGAMIIAVMFSIIGVFTGLNTFFAPGEQMQRHFNASSNYADIVDDVDSEMHRYRKYRVAADVFVMKIKLKSAQLRQNAPVIPLYIVKQFQNMNIQQPETENNNDNNNDNNDITIDVESKKKKKRNDNNNNNNNNTKNKKKKQKKKNKNTNSESDSDDDDGSDAILTYKQNESIRNRGHYLSRDYSRQRLLDLETPPVKKEQEKDDKEKIHPFTSISSMIDLTNVNKNQ